MQQLTQQLKSGHMEILDVPFPALNARQVLVRNHYSVISAGTESKTVTDARKGYVAKARSRQKELKMVLKMARTQGLIETYKTVMNKLEAPSALGYSTAGEVIAVGDGVTEFNIGDKVACGGATASHADVIAVPQNLCVKVPEHVDLKQAAFTTIAAIALQGIRQADVQIGNNCVIIGLGLLGQLSMLLLKAAGVKVIGIDIDEKQVSFANKLKSGNAYLRSQTGLADIVYNATNGHGADAIIITAGTSSLDPVEFAGEIARKKAKVVIVGAVPTGFSRLHYYRKELDLRMSCSYGPGRYDPLYEEKNIDYPIGYVRFTENRNMQTYIDLLSSKQLDVEPLITHTFDLYDAPNAYNMILERSEYFAGILIKYDTGEKLNQSIQLKNCTSKSSVPKIGMIGAGNFAQNILLPRMKGFAEFINIATAQGNESTYVAKKYGFSQVSDNGEMVIHDKDVNTVFVLTRHNLHAKYVIESIKAGKHVYVEKPLAMTQAELKEVKQAYQSSDGNHFIMVGFNRRFAPFIRKVKNYFLTDHPKAINIRINAGVVPPEHWVNDPELGGGRIIGEACHFIDLASFLAGSSIKSVNAHSMSDSNGLDNTISISMEFENGSIASISYFSNGNNLLPKELIEVFCGGEIATINDFKSLHIYGKQEQKFRAKNQDKGHSAEMIEFLKAIKNGKRSPISFQECYNSTLATFVVLDSLRENRVIRMDDDDMLA